LTKNPNEIKEVSSLHGRNTAKKRDKREKKKKKSKRKVLGESGQNLPAKSALKEHRRMLGNSKKKSTWTASLRGAK